MTVAVVAEKPSAARNMAKALLGDEKRMSGAFDGTDIVITALRGHLYELSPPEKQVGASQSEQVRSWSLNNLPWNHKDFSWEIEPNKGASSTIKQVEKVLKSADEAVIATDLDPSGEGFLLYSRLAEAANLQHKPHSRMEFVDESADAFRKAFRNRRKIKSFDTEPEYLKSTYRSRWDFLSMQFTRVFTVCAAQRAVLRQGRLKSAMVQLVGDQLKAHNDYVRKPYFEGRFKDDHGVAYSDPDAARFDTKEAVDLSALSKSEVAVDSRQNKHTKPPRLLDLSTLSARLSGKSYKADDVLKVYQNMYEAQIVSYPRTEDLHITTGQFDEMLPLVDQIAGVIGVDSSILTRREPRKTHVKDSGAHGANRPGLKVPKSLDAIEATYGKLGRLIYEELGRSFLAMFAEDYTYEQQKGHVKDFPKYLGSANVPKAAGWKEVFSADDDDDEETSAKGLGSVAEPFVFEGAPKRPEHPSMKWLMKQLERRSVGTGATRTSTYAEVTNSKAKFPLMSENRGKVKLSEYGDMSYRLLPGTKIGDLSATEQVFATMDEVAAGSKQIDAELAQVADWIAHDMKVVESNAEKMRSDLGLDVQTVAKEKTTGVFNGEEVQFNREWSGYRFSDDELKRLLAGEEIEITAISKRTGNPFGARGKFAKQSKKIDGKQVTWYGFELIDFVEAKDADGNAAVPASWCQVKFTDAEKKKLAAGEGVARDDFVSKKGKKFSATVHFKDEGGRKKIVPSFG